MSASIAGWIAGAAAAIVASLILALRYYRRLAASARRSSSSSATDGTISSTSPSRCRPGSTTSTASVDALSAGVARVDRRVDETVSKTAIVRYDAYENSGGHQSASVALLDSARTGLVLSAIQGRDYARIYVKDFDRGRASVALSPEEREAVDRAMGSLGLFTAFQAV